MSKQYISLTRREAAQLVARDIARVGELINHYKAELAVIGHDEIMENQLALLESARTAFYFARDGKSVNRAQLGDMVDLVAEEMR